jgi:hypothetical protein
MKTLNDEHTTNFFALGTYRLRHPLFLLFKPTLVCYPYFVVFETINHHEIKGKKTNIPMVTPTSPLSVLKGNISRDWMKPAWKHRQATMKVATYLYNYV